MLTKINIKNIVFQEVRLISISDETAHSTTPLLAHLIDGENGFFQSACDFLLGCIRSPSLNVPISKSLKRWLLTSKVIL
jgi:hypothetical protein